MGIGLLEYAEKNPAQEPPEQEAAAIREAATTYRERQEERQQAEELKASIAQQLERGNAPQYILYTAIKAIGLLTHDPEWTEAQQQSLDNVYADIAQQSLFTDNAAIAAARLEKMKQTYNDKLRQQLLKDLNGYRRIEKAITEALQAVNEIDETGILGEPENG